MHDSRLFLLSELSCLVGEGILELLMMFQKGNFPLVYPLVQDNGR